MSPNSTNALRNAESAPFNRIPVLGDDEFRTRVIEGVRDGGRIVALFGVPNGNDTVRLVAVTTGRDAGTLSIFCMNATDRYESLTPLCPQAHWFEREIAEQWGLVPEGHPWLKPIRFHPSYRAGRDAWGRSAADEILPCVTDYFRVEGEEVHEVAVGPVHAGVIEPGHFRFQCHGERVFSLEISLGYQHRGVEKALRGGPDKRSLSVAETLAGDTTIGHAMAYSQLVESMAGRTISERAAALRAVALELERLANHTGDLGALANDVGYLPTASFCGRIRGDFLNLSALLCGNRFGRGMIRPGGVGFDLDAERLKDLQRRFEAAVRDATGAVGLLWNTSSVLARFESTGAVSRDTAEALGLVGMAARASGLSRDVRREFPFGRYVSAPIPSATMTTGDVYARAYVRWLDIADSAQYIRETLSTLPAGPIRAEVGPLAADSICVSMTEGWRGEIVHVALTDSNGRFRHYKVIDPSFHNWAGLAMSLRDQKISDFPLCNKSFNLSYCGHDL